MARLIRAQHVRFLMFVGEPVSVDPPGAGTPPSRFVWRDQVYDVQEILHSWSDWGFGEGSHTRSWRNRRHRNYFQVRTQQGDFELYVDRGVRGERSVWILSRTLDEPSGGETLPPHDEPR